MCPAQMPRQHPAGARGGSAQRRRGGRLQGPPQPICYAAGIPTAGGSNDDNRKYTRGRLPEQAVINGLSRPQTQNTERASTRSLDRQGGDLPTEG